MSISSVLRSRSIQSLRVAIFAKSCFVLGLVLSGSNAWSQEEELPPLRIDPIQSEPRARIEGSNGTPSGLPLTQQESSGQAEATDLVYEGMNDEETVSLTRGPLHEAFAEFYMADPAPGILVPKEPPPMIDEVPPEYRPEGEAMIWIPGYWGWDDDRDDFIWISGVYRLPPDGQKWVPGYWQQAESGWQWISGFWMEESRETISYLELPPATLEQGPSSPAPSSSHIYIPGYWNHSQVGYRWQVGYWYPAPSDFVWVPPRYVWTPLGCVFVNGYWDARLSQRGICYAPAYIAPSVYARPNYFYRPTVLLNTNAIFHNLFSCPRYHHYMFGDYYEARYLTRNIVPVYSYHVQSRGCDPLMSFYSVYYAKQGRDLGRWYQDYHRELRLDVAKRPPHSWNQIQDHHRAGVDPDWIADNVRNAALASVLSSKMVANPQFRRSNLQTIQAPQKQLADQRRELEKISKVPRDLSPLILPPSKLDPPKKPSLGQTERARTPDLQLPKSTLSKSNRGPTLPSNNGNTVLGNNGIKNNPLAQRPGTPIPPNRDLKTGPGQRVDLLKPNSSLPAGGSTILGGNLPPSLTQDLNRGNKENRLRTDLGRPPEFGRAPDLGRGPGRAPELGGGKTILGNTISGAPGIPNGLNPPSNPKTLPPSFQNKKLNPGSGSTNLTNPPLNPPSFSGGNRGNSNPGQVLGSGAGLGAGTGVGAGLGQGQGVRSGSGSGQGSRFGNGLGDRIGNPGNPGNLGGGAGSLPGSGLGSGFGSQRGGGRSQPSSGGPGFNGGSMQGGGNGSPIGGRRGGK